MKLEELDDGAGVSKRESAFTYDNPFQSGSSPPPETSSGERKRKSLGSSASRDSSRRKSSAVRKVTPGPKADDGIHPPTSATFEIPVSALNGLKDVDANGVEASEEFTPEAQMELVRERAANGINAVGPLRPKRQQSRGISKKAPIWMALITLLGGYATWYRQEKIAVGYCGVGRDAKQIIPTNIAGTPVVVPDWVKVLAEPQCELCPQHAYCLENFETQCENDFVLKPHPLSFGGLVPLPPTCEPDGEKVRRVKAVADRAVEELRERRAKFECGELTDEAGLPEPTVEIDAEQLKKEVSKKRKSKLSEAEFEELWGAAIGEIQGRDEVVSAADG
jgi:Man1-Src1p-C-terminal domain